MLHPHQLKVPMMSTLNENIDSPKPPFPGKNRQALAEDSHIAAFFDLDKTILATASAMALSTPLVHAGVMSRWDSLRATIVQLPYLFTGADDDRMRSMMHALGELTRGWDPQYVEKIVNSVTSSSIAPLCYRQALALIDHHRLLGHHVVIASASPMEIVRPIAHHCWTRTRRAGRWDDHSLQPRSRKSRSLQKTRRRTRVGPQRVLRLHRFRFGSAHA